jgi:pimeloyl-ACP methyl ester carboxylesterase
MDKTRQLEMLRKAVEIAGLGARQIDLPQDHQLIIGTMRFHYLDWGGNGHPILFLHGGGINAHTWDVVALMLHDRYAVSRSTSVGTAIANGRPPSTMASRPRSATSRDSSKRSSSKSRCSSASRWAGSIRWPMRCGTAIDSKEWW